MACNNSDCGQWPKQGAVVGAAASKMQANAKQLLGAATRARVRGENSRHTADIVLQKGKQNYDLSH